MVSHILDFIGAVATCEVDFEILQVTCYQVGGGFKHFSFLSLPGEIIHFDDFAYFFICVGSTTN